MGRNPKDRERLSVLQILYLLAYIKRPRQTTGKLKTSTRAMMMSIVIESFIPLGMEVLFLDILVEVLEEFVETSERLVRWIVGKDGNTAVIYNKGVCDCKVSLLINRGQFLTKRYWSYLNDITFLFVLLREACLIIMIIYAARLNLGLSSVLRRVIYTSKIWTISLEDMIIKFWFFSFK